MKLLRKLATASPPLVIRRASGGQAESGMVVEDVQDLHLGAVGQPPMGDVGLPAFVGLIGAKHLPRRAGPFLRLRGDKAAAGQDPPDRRDRRHRINAAVAAR
jgi:hypothetical protein